jgi:peptidyl-prolyl cis-trans isomerase D
MLDVLRRGSRWIMGAVILVVGGVFVFYLGLGGGGFAGGPAPNVVVDVDGRSYDLRDVDRVRRRTEEEYRRALGEAFDSQAAAAYLDQQAASSLMRAGLMAHEAEALGLRVSDGEVRDYLKSMSGATDESGRLDREGIERFAESEYGSVRRFQERLRDELLMQKAVRLLGGSASVSDTDAREALLYQLEEVEIGYVALDPSRPPPGMGVSEEQARALLEREPDRVRNAYDDRRSEFEQPERVRARHLLVRVAEDAPPDVVEKAKARAEEALTRIRGGADFAEVAREVSDDQGSREQGGDLGLFPRGRMVKPFEDAAFGLEVGQTSEVVRSVHGFHVLRVEERRPAESTPFEEVDERLARDLLLAEVGEKAAREGAEALFADVRAGTSLVEAARKLGVSVERPDPLRRRPDGYVPGLGPAPEVQLAAFAATLERPTPQRIFEVQGKRVLIQLLARHTPPDEEIQAKLAETRRSLLAERRQRMEAAWLEATRTRLADAGRLHYDAALLETR